tara:strand:+ start:248 stop:931 length:684 start_codon:yes stop_codon:yes gene_type:complete
MHRLIDRGKIYFYLVLLLILLSIHNLNLVNNINNFFKIKKIILISNIEEALNQEISNSLDKYYSRNIFSLDSGDIKTMLDKFNIISEYKIKKEYPSVIKINLIETKILAYYFENNQKIYVGENGKKIRKKQIVSNDLPIIEGEVDIKKFLKLKKALINNGFKLNDFIIFYFNKSNRWDLVYNNQIIVKLPIDEINYSISLFKDIIESSNIDEIKIIDLRIKNRIVLL